MNFATLKINQQQWRAAGQRLIEMAIAEFLYEEIIEVKALSAGRYRLDLGNRQYEFQGHQYLLGHWNIQEASVRDVTHSQENDQPAWNLHEFIVAMSDSSNVKPFTKAYLIKEMNNTWLAEAHLFNETRLPSIAVLTEPHYKVEGMLRGHPWLIMSKGRMGFGYDDYLSAAPELSPEVKVLWLAVHRDLAEYRSTEDWSACGLYQHEFDANELQQFINILQEKNLDPQNYFLIPVHAWQWHQWLVPTYANEIVDQKIIELNISQDSYVPMQSIRTLCNTSNLQRHYIKLPVSIFNTAVYRGLPSKRNLAAPAVTAWLKQIHQQDQDLQNTGVIFLGEVATLTIHQPCFDRIDGAPYQFKELFGCLWRESVDRYVDPSHQVLSQAALLHRDISGQSILSVLIQASGLSPLAWLAQFAQVSMSPLLLCLYRYGLAFSPHGENTMLVHENGVPKAMVLKDFIDDINLVDEDFPELTQLPSEADLLLRHEATDLSHFIFTGLFMVHYRYICNVFLQDYPEYSELDFWQTISNTIVEFNQKHPELAERADKFAMLRPSYTKICLNRVRLFTTSYNDEAERPVPVFLDPIANPVSPETLKTWAQQPRQAKVG
ncbi:acinetoferrin biosynthesis protein AcbC [Acinetobacter haemolyticus]|uniref:Acinetoferrin biosynthesis protein AcbC n=1 Tax=Acinetobacter haemolyticus TaxID=29430 RepID=A0AAJ2YSC0_ACIHA|nr:acinetoferrin biosynthesis protein AcbC [Acinetobacter haemolyticus]NAR18002.1 acinetoferrin biosynthesis protein AcbC [Acinetobacter haemolyticus]NAR29791.1 acinetoferrin biosynthesis protein AcbC [Acinetobacter haemolyticus]NAR35330.1 acinetoferrin biosynthesis protein AcbC [Acinetobacter haemolyticus]NAR46406.1 acinetoferrin biosynthesis protein AcbC [Acinetobacter haemolyticus]NAR63224.1 acinetoferrin biosynthesis protein AcbC [Acinetobacter haemolyticus]